jgi:hypothetical protein
MVNLGNCERPDVHTHRVDTLKTSSGHSITIVHSAKGASVLALFVNWQFEEQFKWLTNSCLNSEYMDSALALLTLMHQVGDANFASHVLNFITNIPASIVPQLDTCDLLEKPLMQSLLKRIPFGFVQAAMCRPSRAHDLLHMARLRWLQVKPAWTNSLQRTMQYELPSEWQLHLLRTDPSLRNALGREQALSRLLGKYVISDEAKFKELEANLTGRELLCVAHYFSFQVFESTGDRLLVLMWAHKKGEVSLADLRQWYANRSDSKLAVEQQARWSGSVYRSELSEALAFLKSA